MAVTVTPQDETADGCWATFEAFARALRRQAHALHEHPDLTWQQLYNGPLWEGECRRGTPES